MSERIEVFKTRLHSGDESDGWLERGITVRCHPRYAGATVWLLRHPILETAPMPETRVRYRPGAVEGTVMGAPYWRGDGWAVPVAWDDESITSTTALINLTPLPPTIEIEGRRYDAAQVRERIAALEPVE